MSAKIKTTYTQHEPLAQNYSSDVSWINENRLALYEQYGDCVLLVYHQQVIGKGANINEAIGDAESRLTDETGMITPVIKYLTSPYRIGVYRSKPEQP